MRPILPLAIPALVCFALVGCVTPRLDREVSPSTSAETSAPSETAKLDEQIAAAEKEAEALQALARRPADAGMSATELVVQLNEASRELGALRVSNAKLKAERSRAATPRVETVVKPEANDEKLSAGVRSFAQFKQELAGFLDETEKLRTENAALNAQLGTLTAQIREAQAQLEPLRAEAANQREARDRAELAAEKLRDQLRTIAKALAAAGLSLDALSGEREPTARLETSPARLRAAAEEPPR